MKLILCLDDHNGMFFCGRRQSSDRLVTAHILQTCEGQNLWMNSYSKKLFKDAKNTLVSEQFLQLAGEDDFVFAENADVVQLLPQVRMLIIYRWNRVYPSDVKIHGQFPPIGWVCLNKVAFAGYSHEKITQEVYIRETE